MLLFGLGKHLKIIEGVVELSELITRDFTKGRVQQADPGMKCMFCGDVVADGDSSKMCVKFGKWIILDCHFAEFQAAILFYYDLISLISETEKRDGRAPTLLSPKFANYIETTYMEKVCGICGKLVNAGYTDATEHGQGDICVRCVEFGDIPVLGCCMDDLLAALRDWHDQSIAWMASDRLAFLTHKGPKPAPGEWLYF